jgi:AcrR family transcriptional regulator
MYWPKHLLTDGQSNDMLLAYKRDFEKPRKTMVKITRGLKKRREEIIATARHLFQTNDYDKITMQNIVDELEIAKGTIFYYFDSKEVLLKAVVENIIEEDKVRKEALITTTKGNALDKIRALIQLDSMAAKNPTILKHLHRPSNAQMHTQLLAVMVIQEASLYAKLIQQGCAEGIFQTDTPFECAEFIIAAIQFLTDQGIFPWTESDVARRMHTFPALVETILKAKPGSFQFMIDRLLQ